MRRELLRCMIFFLLLGVGPLFGQGSSKIDHLEPVPAFPTTENEERYRQAKFRALIGSRCYLSECWAIATPPNEVEYAIVIERIWGMLKPGGKVGGIVGYRLRLVVAKTSIRRWVALISEKESNSSSVAFPETTEWSADISLALGEVLNRAWRSVLLGTKYSRFSEFPLNELRYEFYNNPFFFGQTSISAVGNAASIVKLSELLISYTKASESVRPTILLAIQKCASVISSPASS